MLKVFFLTFKKSPAEFETRCPPYYIIFRGKDRKEKKMQNAQQININKMTEVRTMAHLDQWKCLKL